MDDEKQLRRAEDDPGIVPCKKIKTDVPLVSGDQAPKIGPFPDVANGRGDIESATDGADSSHRDTKSPSHELDDMQGSSGNSSNIENGDATEDDSGNISDSSSHASSGDWQRRPTGIIAWVHTQMMSGVDPRKILRYLIPNISHVPQTISDLSLWQLIVSILSEPQRRPKLQHINTMHDAVDLISKAKNILVLTGAGVSVSCGIPDFRSRDGIYARLAVDFPDLPDPQAMFDISYFTKDPRPFFKFAKEIYPGQFKPSRSHRFISLLQKTGRLLRNYTQNIDTLEQVAGISKVIQCHGSFATASCLKCHHKVDCEVIRKDIFNQHVPHCPQCSDEEELAIMKPDIVFFGESLPEHFHRQMSKDKDEADLLIVIGSSLKVRPVALIPSSLPDHIPQILINREPLPHVEFDVELLGDGDVIVGEICKRLGSEFSALGEETNPLVEIDELPKESPEKTRLPSNESNEGSSSKSDSGRSSQDDDAAAEPQDTIADSLDKPQHTSSSNVSPSTETTSHASKVSSDVNVKETDCGGCENVLENAKDTKQTTHSDTTPDLSLDASPLEVDKCSNVVKQETRSGDGDKCRAGEKLDKKKTDKDSTLNHCRSTDALSSEKQDGQVGAVEEDVEINSKCEKRKMWRSRWKQSVSKRLPGGTFYYNGKNRYIFPGAEIAPEEDDDDDDDSELSDFDPDSNADGKSSDEESDDAPPVGTSFGPGGLSSTKRDLRTSSTIHSLQQSFLHSCHDHDHEPCTVIHVDHDDEVEGTSECSETKDETTDRDSQSQPEDTKKRDAVDTDGEGEGASAVVSNHLKCPDSRSDAVEVTHEESTPNQRDSIVPDELHDLVLETASTEPKQGDSRSHSPLPPDLHKILANDPPHPQHPPHPLAKSDSEVPDTDQILCLPSSSLLPPLGEYAAEDTDIKSSEGVGSVTDTQRE